MATSCVLEFLRRPFFRKDKEGDEGKEERNQVEYNLAFMHNQLLGKVCNTTVLQTALLLSKVTD